MLLKAISLSSTITPTGLGGSRRRPRDDQPVAAVVVGVHVGHRRVRTLDGQPRIEVLFELGAVDDAVAVDDEGETQLGAARLAEVLENPAQDRGPGMLAGPSGPLIPMKPPFWPSMTAPARRSRVGNFCPVQIVPDKRYSPFAKEKVAPLDSMRACRSVPGRTCTPRQVDEDDEDCEVLQLGMRTASAQSTATRCFVRAEPGTRVDELVAGLQPFRLPPRRSTYPSRHPTHGRIQ
jgi:hypothetical protein